MQLTSHNEIIDKDTGVIISESSKSIKIPDRVFINGSFTKVFDSSRFDLNHIELGYLMMLLPYMEYQTNRLTISYRGVKSKKILQKEMSQILKISIRRMASLYHSYKNKKIIFKIDGWYYVSPRYALKGKVIYIDVFCKMMNCDDLNDLCSRKDLFIINKYKKIKR